MAKEDLSVKIGASFVGKAAFRQAEKSITKLGKQAASLALGGGLLAFGRSSVQAFYESEKSAKALYGTLNNLNLAFRKNDVNRYIDKLSLATGIVDETLNPAFQQLLITTRSVEKSQKILGVALDVSATTGDSLGNTVDALSKAYQGNTKGLASLKIGLSKAQLSANNFDDILKYLAITFEGQASEAAKGFTGDLDKLKVAVDQFKESIGKGIASGLSNSNGEIDSTTNALTNLGAALGKLIELNLKVSPLQIFSKQFWKDLVGTPIRGVKGMGDGSDRGGASKVADAKMAARQKAAADAQLKATKALTKAQQDQLKLKKAGTMFDTEQANILIALQGKITDNEKLRLELQLALLQGNTKEADRLSNELLISQARTTGLASFIANLPKALNPFADYPFYVQQALAELAKIQNAQSQLGASPNKYDQIQAKLTAQNIAMGIDPGAAAGLAASSARLQAEADAYFKANPNIDPMTGAVINVKVEVGGQQLTDIVTTQQLNNSASGSQSRINRLALMD